MRIVHWSIIRGSKGNSLPSSVLSDGLLQRNNQQNARVRDLQKFMEMCLTKKSFINFKDFAKKRLPFSSIFLQTLKTHQSTQVKKPLQLTTSVPISLVCTWKQRLTPFWELNDMILKICKSKMCRAEKQGGNWGCNLEAKPQSVDRITSSRDFIVSLDRLQWLQEAHPCEGRSHTLLKNYECKY